MKNHTPSKTLGPKETEVIARLSYEKVSLFTLEQFHEWFHFAPASRKQIIFRLKKKGMLTAVKRGVYYYSPLESGPAGSNINEFLIPSVLFPKGNYYVGYSTMYNYHGFTDQIFQVMHILNTSVQRRKSIGNTQFEMIKTPTNRMYGLEKIKMNHREVVVSDKERTLVDLFYFPEPVGGLARVFEILNDMIKSGGINTSRLILYATRFPNVATRKRIGYALEQAGWKKKQIEPLLKSVKKTSLITLYPSRSRKGRINRKWMVIENAS